MALTVVHAAGHLVHCVIINDCAGISVAHPDVLY
jgi:hypothetical protein